MNNFVKLIFPSGYSGKKEFLPLAIKVVSCARPFSDDIKFLDRIDTTSLKRGRGGRSSFSGVVATVFGASGFTGDYVCSRLGRNGTQMIIPYRGDFYSVQRFKLYGDLGQVLFIPFDIYDEEAMRKAVKYSNVVINLIGRQWETSNFSFQKANIDSARQIAKICKEEGVPKLIHVSALNCNVDHPGYFYSGGSKFLKSKYESEKVVREHFPEAIIFRPSDIWGRYDYFLSYFNSVFRYSGTCLGLPHKGIDIWKQPVYVGDFAQGIIKAVFDDSLMGKTIEAIGPRRYELCELIDWFHRVTRRNEKYRRGNLIYAPFVLLKAILNGNLKYPRSAVTLDKIERDVVSDVITGLPKLGDLGIALTKMEDRIAWELKSYNAYAYYAEELGEFEKPSPPKFIELKHA